MSQRPSSNISHSVMTGGIDADQLSVFKPFIEARVTEACLAHTLPFVGV